MGVHLIEERHSSHAAFTALISSGRAYTYLELSTESCRLKKLFQEAGIEAGAVVTLEGACSFLAIASLFALIRLGVILVPICQLHSVNREVFIELSSAQFSIQTGSSSDPVVTRLPSTPAPHEILAKLMASRQPGLVLFSSGTTGVSKGVVHDLNRLLSKFQGAGKKKRTLAFMTYDHIGGFDTLMYTMLHGGCLIAVEDRSPEAVCRLIESSQAEVLPTSPTFLNLLLLSECAHRFNLNSLQVITYGAEVMPESLLRRCQTVFPAVQFVQKYGLSELGALQTRSRDDGSLWMSFTGKGSKFRVKEGLLEIKADTAMLGYLNAPSPFTEDGWLVTGDSVVVDGEWLRVLGRKTSMINVGGEKVFPAEIENVLRELPGVLNVVVSGEANPLLGSIVRADFNLAKEEGLGSLRQRVAIFCKDRLDAYKIPQKIVINMEELHTNRFKKVLKPADG